MKASQQREHGISFLASSTLISLCSVTQVCCVFSNRISLSSYSVQPKAMAIAWVVLGAPWTSLNNTSMTTGRQRGLGAEIFT